MSVNANSRPDSTSSSSARKSSGFRKSDNLGAEFIGQDGIDPLFWGPYLSERQWGTVREDASFGGSSWKSISYSDATRQAYKWGEDGLLGVSDKYGILCSSLALWNGCDSHLKERLFGLDSHEGNHGEDVKELYYYLDNTPTHNYMRALYKYPRYEFPYKELIDHGRSATESEYEILDTGIFDQNDYWDIQVEYAKSNNFNLICKYSIMNRSSKPAKLHIIPQFFFRNTWAGNKAGKERNSFEVPTVLPNFQYQNSNCIGVMYDAGIFNINLFHSSNVNSLDVMFTNNESVDNSSRDSQGKNSSYGKKDAFHRYVIFDDSSAFTYEKIGTKCGVYMTCRLAPRDQAFVYWQITPVDLNGETSMKKLDYLIKDQRKKAEEFYRKIIPKGVSADQANICRQAIAGLLWSKQFYLYNAEEKNKEYLRLHGDEFFESKFGKKKNQWKHMRCHDILLVPDKWEFPWFASWDTAFQAVLFASFDLNFAKDQIRLMLSDRYMHPNGQIPGCEFDFGDPNPPIIAWAAWKIHQFEKPWNLEFVKICYPRLIISYQWWHKMDSDKSYLYGHGFLGMDNISVFDRSHLPGGMSNLKQADATGWVGQFALTMLMLTLEQCNYDVCLSDMAVRFLKDFLFIAKALNQNIGKGGLWHEEDGFYYDVVQYGKKKTEPVCLRSWSGIVPLFACGRINLENAPMVKEFLMTCDRGYSPYVSKLGDNEFFLSLVPYIRLKAILSKVFSEQEFLSPFGIRSLSKVYEENPFYFSFKGVDYNLRYTPGESDAQMFGGNSNWRGPIWMCMNYLLIESLEMYSSLDKIFTHPLSMEYPVGNPGNQRKSFQFIAHDLCQRLVHLYAPDSRGIRPALGEKESYLQRHWNDLILFYEYFNAESGLGCGASHQTGWSALYLEFLKKMISLRPTAFKKKQM